MNRRTIISTKIFAILALTLASANSTATEIHLAKKINFISLKTERSSLDTEYDIIKIVGLAKYGNSCKVKDFKFKTLNQKGNEFKYDIFGSDGDTDSCPMIYLPIDKSYVIDQIKIPRDLDIKVFVNGSMID